MESITSNATTGATAYPLYGNEIRLTPAMARTWAVAGIAAVDAHQGNYGWRQSINLATLDMADGSACVLGQIYGAYWRAPSTLRDMPYFGGNRFVTELHSVYSGEFSPSASERRWALLHSMLTDAYAAVLAPLASATN